MRRPSLEADITTAGSVTLSFDTVLPIAAVYDEPFQLTATGGTNVKWAPTVEYHELVKVPLLGTCGVDVDIDLVKAGFYPAGGGKATLQTISSSMSSLEFEVRGNLERVEIYSKAAEVLAERDVTDRQANHAQERLENAGFPAEIQRVEYASYETDAETTVYVAAELSGHNEWFSGGWSGNEYRERTRVEPVGLQSGWVLTSGELEVGIGNYR